MFSALNLNCRDAGIDAWPTLGYSVSSVDPTWGVITPFGSDRTYCESRWVVVHQVAGAWTVQADLDFNDESCGFVPTSLETARDLDVCAHARQCVTPAQPKGLRSALRSAARIPGQRAPKGPLGKLRFGTCGSTSYALAKFSQPQVGTTDQPTLLRRRPGGHWRVVTDSSGPLCELADNGLPLELMDQWFISPFDCA